MTIASAPGYRFDWTLLRPLPETRTEQVLLDRYNWHEERIWFWTDRRDQSRRDCDSAAARRCMGMRARHTRCANILCRAIERERLGEAVLRKSPGRSPGPAGRGFLGLRRAIEAAMAHDRHMAQYKSHAWSNDLHGAINAVRAQLQSALRPRNRPVCTQPSLASYGPLLNHKHDRSSPPGPGGQHRPFCHPPVLACG
jgi:hypothetical protein